MKKTNVCLISTLVLAMLCLGADSRPDRVTLHPAPHKPGDIASDADWVILPRTGLYEIGASKLGISSIRELPDTGFRELTEQEARFYTGPYFQCPADKTPYLFRAVYRKNGFMRGQFRAERHGNSLAIVFCDGPGASSEECERTAVIINLDFTPDAVYTETSSFSSSQ